MKLDWDLLVESFTETGKSKVSLGFIINYHGFTYLIRRRPHDYLSGSYEFPVCIKGDQESVFEAGYRILKEEFNLVIKEITNFAGSFEYTSRSGNKTRQFNFIVEVEDPMTSSITRHDHGVWVHQVECLHFPVMFVCLEQLASLWWGEGYDSMIAHTLVEGAKKENIWRHSVRAFIHNQGKVLLLKRSRRKKQFPLTFELPGKHVEYGEDLDSAIRTAVESQTGVAPEGIERCLGYYDYLCPQSQETIREFIYSVIPQQKKAIKLRDHSMYTWVSDYKYKEIQVVPSVNQATQQFIKAYFLNRPKKIVLPPPSFKEFHGSEANKNAKEVLPALWRHEIGQVLNEKDLKILKGVPMTNRSLATWPKEIREEFLRDS